MSQYIDPEFEYQPESLEGAIFLSEVPVSLMKNQLLSQFQEPLEYRKRDVVSSFIDKYNQSLEIEVPEDDLDDLEKLKDDFIIYLKELFEDYLHIGFPNLEMLDLEDQFDLLHFTYRFFIRNIKKNFVNLILNYIDENKDELCTSVSRKKDITSLSLKKELNNPDDILIIANLSDITDIVFEEYRNGTKYDIMDFIKSTDYSNPSLETEFVYDKFDSDDITGNFIKKYISMVDNDFQHEIELKVRTKYLKTNRK